MARRVSRMRDPSNEEVAVKADQLLADPAWRRGAALRSGSVSKHGPNEADLVEQAHVAARDILRGDVPAAPLPSRLDRRRKDRHRRWQVARDQLLTDGKAATDASVGEKLGLPDRTIRQWRADGDIPA